MSTPNRPSRSLFLSAFALALLGMVAVTRADEVVKITACPFVITAPGHYLLVTDLVCPLEGIVIQNTSDVHLDLGGHTLDGAGTGQRGVRVSGSTEVNIQNGTITGFRGILGADGLNITDSSRVFATNLNLHANSDGITLFRATNNLVINCNASANMRHGIEMADVTANEIRGNKINGNGVWGVLLYTQMQPSQQNLLVANELLGNVEFGIRLQLVLNNTIRNNRVHGTVGPNGTGIFLGQSSSNTVRNNRTTENVRGIVVGVASLNNVIETNTSLENAVFDLEDRNPACDANVWRNNNFNMANQPCVQ